MLKKPSAFCPCDSLFRLRTASLRSLASLGKYGCGAALAPSSRYATSVAGSVLLCKIPLSASPLTPRVTTWSRDAFAARTKLVPFAPARLRERTSLLTFAEPDDAFRSPPLAGSFHLDLACSTALRAAKLAAEVLVEPRKKDAETMGYLQEFDVWLDERLSEDGLLDDRKYKLDEEKIAKIKREIKEKILESYRNGQKDGLKKVWAVLGEEADDLKRRYEAVVAKQEGRDRSGRERKR